jgi:hypothetical protein
MQNDARDMCREASRAARRRFTTRLESKRCNAGQRDKHDADENANRKRLQIEVTHSETFAILCRAPER